MKKLLVPAVMLLTLIGSGFTVKSQTADEIIDKYIAAIGGKENWKKVNSIKMEGNIEVQGIQIPYTVQAVNGKGFRSEGEFQGNFFIDIVTPAKGWSQNPMAGKTTLQPLNEDELKAKLDDLDIQGAFIDYKEKGSTIESLGKITEDGNEYFKVKLTTKNKIVTTYYFDSKTYLVYKQESTTKSQGEDVTAIIKHLDYTEIKGGIKMPFKLDQGQMVIAITKVTVNDAIDEKIFSDK